MLYFFTTLAIGHLPPLDMCCVSSDLPVHLNARSCNVTFGRVSSGSHSAIHGKVRSGDVGGFRTREKRCHCGNLLNMPIAVERSGGLLRYRPITRSGIQLCVDRARLDVVDRDAPAPDLSG